MDLFIICADQNGADYNGDPLVVSQPPSFSFSIHSNDFVLHKVRKCPGHISFLMAWMNLPEGLIMRLQ